MGIKIRQPLQSLSLALVTLLFGLMLNSCQAFEQPPQGVLTPQELIFTSAAETVVANLTPAPETPGATQAGMGTHSPTPGQFQQLTHTPGPTPALVLDFEDDFRDQGYWETSNEEEHRAYYAPEGFRIENHAEEGIYSNTIWLDYGDVRVEVSAGHMAGPESAQFGVVCRWQDDNNFYSFLIGKTGNFTIARTQNGETTLLEEGKLELEMLPAGQTWRVAGGCLGHRLILELDGQVLVETRDEAFPVGLVGLAVGSRGEAGAEVSFESFRVFTPVLELAPLPTQTQDLEPASSPSPFAIQTPSPTPVVPPEPSPTLVPTLPTPTDLPQPTRTPLLTAGPTDTPPPPVTATASPSLVLEDDFTVRTGWHTETQPGFEMYYQAGGYRIHNRNTDSNVSSTRTFEHQDIRVEVDAAMVSVPAGGYYGVVCRFQNLQNLYAFVIGSDGFHAIVKIQNSEVSFLEEGRADNGPILLEGEVNRVTGICQGSQLALEVNGQRLLEAEDLTFVSGNVGLLVGNREQPGSLVHFDNFALHEP